MLKVGAYFHGFVIDAMQISHVFIVWPGTCQVLKGAIRFAYKGAFIIFLDGGYDSFVFLSFHFSNALL